MSKPANHTLSSHSRFSAALLISLLASLGACATLDPSQRQSMSPATRSAPAVQPSESFFGYVKDPADHPTGPAFFGYHDDPAGHPAGPAFFGYREDPADRPTGPSFFGYYKDSVVRSAPAAQPSHEPQTPVAARR
jgi:hypothetical protein